MSLKKQAIKGGVWTTASYGVQAIVQILRLSVLTRFLEKSDFGLVAIVTLVLGFTHIFADLGVSVSLFSVKDITKRQYSSLYWVSLLLGLFLYSLLWAATPFIANFYHQTELNQLIPIMGLDLIITTAGRQFKVFKQKELQFKSIAIIEIVAAILSMLIAILLAKYGYGIYSLVYSTLFATTLGSFLLIISNWSYHPLQLVINYSECKSFYRIGIYQTGGQILDYFSSQLDIIIIGRVMNMSDLGVYNLMKQLILRIYGILNPIVTSVMIPILLKLYGTDSFRKKYLDMIAVTTFMNFLIYGVVAMLSETVLYVLYGSTYVIYATILSALALWGALLSATNVASTIVSISGRTDRSIVWALVRLTLNPIIVIIGALNGVYTLSISLIFYAFIQYGLYFKVVIQKIYSVLRWVEYYRIVLKNFLILLIFLVFRYMLKDLIFEAHVLIWELILALLYVLCVLFFNRILIFTFLHELKPLKTPEVNKEP